jgi:hypothetical protein
MEQSERTDLIKQQNEAKLSWWLACISTTTGFQRAIYIYIHVEKHAFAMYVNWLPALISNETRRITFMYFSPGWFATFFLPLFFLLFFLFEFPFLFPLSEMNIKCIFHQQCLNRHLTCTWIHCNVLLRASINLYLSFMK